MTQATILRNLVLISALWGACFPAIRFVVAELSPYAMTAGRGFVAAGALVLFLWLAGAAWSGFASVWRHALVLGLMNGLLPNVLNGFALRHIESLAGALVQATTPVFIAVIAALAIGERSITARSVAGMALGFAGVAVILGPAAWTGGATLWGVVLMLGVAACYGAATVYMRWARPESSASLVVLQQVSYAVPALVIGAALAGPGGFEASWQVWAVVVVLGLLGSALPLTLFVSTLRHATAGQASIVGYLQPLGAALAGALFLGEVPEWRVVAGGVVVLAGCWMIAGRPRA
jgi:drug/metabolite transporter (DMT)-like permease